MLTVVGTGVGHVLEGDGGIHTEPFGNGLETLRAEGTLGINVDGLERRMGRQVMINWLVLN